MERVHETNHSSARRVLRTSFTFICIAGAPISCILAVLIVVGCAAGLPSIPNEPNAIIEKGEDHFRRGKYFQAQELFKAFLAKYPGNDRSDYAQFMLAESYLKDKEYPLAAVEYRVIIGDYGYSEFVDDALFKEGVCFYEQAPKSRLDQTRSFEALSRFNQFLKTFPRSPLVGEVNRYISLIHEKLAKKDLKNAAFYLRHNYKDSATIYLDKIIEDYQGNDYWAEAMFLKGKLCLEKGDKVVAKKLFEGVVNYPKELEFTREAKAELERLKGE